MPPESQLCTEFEQTINEDTSHVPLTIEELAGLSNAYLEGLQPIEEGGHSPQPQCQEDAIAPTKYCVGLKHPEAMPVLLQATNEATRKAVEVARVSRCPGNVARLAEIVRVRHEAALLLGFDCHCSYVLAVKMAKTREQASGFVEDLLGKLRPLAVGQRDALVAYQGGRGGDTDDMTSWNRAFYSRLQKEETFNIDEEAISKFFPLNTVLKRLMDIYSELLNLRFVAVQDTVWHADVAFYEVRDGDSGEVVGHFFLDLFPREGKFGHQCVLPIRPSYQRPDGSFQTPVAALIGNNPKPTPDNPSLLRHTQVVTIFHEFGHVMHAVCTKSRYPRFGWAWSAVPYPGS